MLIDSVSNRRQALNQLCIGFGGLALSSMLPTPKAMADREGIEVAAQIPARAKRIIFLFMHGGPSHIDLFDPKPQLDRDDGKKLPFDGSRVTFADRGNLMRSPWKFRNCGKSGIPMSELWQHLPKVADDLCMVHSVCETNVAHGGACMKLHTGDEAQLRPSTGSWISYGLGSANETCQRF